MNTILLLFAIANTALWLTAFVVNPAPPPDARRLAYLFLAFAAAFNGTYIVLTQMAATK